jgi:hypothetical protein
MHDRNERFGHSVRDGLPYFRRPVRLSWFRRRGSRIHGKVSSGLPVRARVHPCRVCPTERARWTVNPAVRRANTEPRRAIPREDPRMPLVVRPRVPGSTPVPRRTVAARRKEASDAHAARWRHESRLRQSAHGVGIAPRWAEASGRLRDVLGARSRQDRQMNPAVGTGEISARGRMRGADILLRPPTSPPPLAQLRGTSIGAPTAVLTV